MNHSLVLFSAEARSCAAVEDKALRSMLDFWVHTEGSFVAGRRNERGTEWVGGCQVLGRYVLVVVGVIVVAALVIISACCQNN